MGKPDDSSSFCLNCRSQFEVGFEPVSQISVLFRSGSCGEDEDEGAEPSKHISILEALSTVFMSRELVKLKIGDCGKGLSMCFRCADTLSGLYQAYIQFLTFSDSSARICCLIRQIDLWHQKQGLPPTHDPLQVKEEVEDGDGSESDGNFTHYHYVDVDSVLSVEMEAHGSPKAENVEYDSQPQRRRQTKENSSTVKEERPVLPEHSGGVRRSSRVTASRTRIIPNLASKAAVLAEIKVKKKRKYKTKLPPKAIPNLGTSAAPPKKRRRPASDSDSEDSEEDHSSDSNRSSSSSARQNIISIANDVLEDDGRVKKRKYTKKPRPPSAAADGDKKRYDRNRKLVVCTHSGCKRKYLSNWRMQQHIFADHQKRKPLRCQLCEFKCFEAEDMTSHVCVTKEERESQNLLFRCDRCGKPCPTLGASRHHTTWHDYKYREVLKCQVEGCKLEYRSRLRFQTHLEKVHGGGNDPAKKPEKVQCQICGNFYSHLKIHMLSHSLVKRFLCTECGKSFSRANLLQEHMRTHSADRNYQCQLCRVCFKRPNHLSRHYRSSAHAEADPNQIAELVKHVVKHKTDDGPVIIPPRYKFKDHHLWAKNRKSRAPRVVSSQGQDDHRAEHPEQSDGSGHEGVPESSIPSQPPEEEEPPPQFTHTFPFTSSGPFQPHHAMFPSRHHPQMYGYPDYY